MLEVQQYQTAKERWDVVKQQFMVKSTYAWNALYQSFIDMQCLKGGDICTFLSSLMKWCNELLAASVTIGNKDFERTVLNSIPDPLATYALQFLGQARLNGKPLEMRDIIYLLSKEADRIKTHCAPKDQAHAQGKGKASGQPDKALAATSAFEGSDGRHHKGKCHHCGKEGHWVCKCCTRKREKAVAAADQTGQTAQVNLGTTSKPKNKPVGSANHVTTNDNNLYDRGFWAVEEVHACYAELDHCMDNLDSNDKDKAFCTKTWGTEDKGNLDWARPDNQLVNEGEELEAKEEARAATLPEEDSTPCTGSQPASHNVPHVHDISSDLEPRQAPDEEGHKPHIGDGCLRTTSSPGEQVVDTMCLAHHPHDVVDSLEFTYPNNPKRAICARKGQLPSFNAVIQAHRAPWLRPGTTTKEQDVPLAPAALLKGEEKRLPAVSSEQTAAPGTPSTSNALKSPASLVEATSPQLSHGLDSLPAQPCRTMCTHIPLYIVHNIQSGDVVHLGTNAPHLAPCLQASKAFAEVPDEAGGVMTMEDSVLAPPQDSKIMELALVAETADTEALQPCALKFGTTDIVLVDIATLTLVIEITSGVSTKLIPCNTVKPLAAPVPPLTDPAPASAAVCVITYDMPHYKAIDTSNWAALAMRPDTIFSDVNSSMAVDRRITVTLGWASYIIGSTIPWLSKRQEDVPLPTTMSNHTAATHGSKEAPWPCSPVSDTFGDPRPSIPHFLTTNHPSHSHAIANTIPWTMHIDMQLSLIPPAHSLQMTPWPTHPATPSLPPWRSTSLHPMDCARSEGECCGSGSQPGHGQVHWIKDHTLCAASAQHASASTWCFRYSTYSN